MPFPTVYSCYKGGVSHFLGLLVVAFFISSFIRIPPSSSEYSCADAGERKSRESFVCGFSISAKKNLWQICLRARLGTTSASEIFLPKCLRSRCARREYLMSATGRKPVKTHAEPFLNYKSAALNQLSYAGVPHTKAVFNELIKSSSWPFRAVHCKKDRDFTVLFYGTRNGHDPRGAGFVATDGVQHLNR